METLRFTVQISQLRKEQDGFCDYSETINSFDNKEAAIDYAESLNDEGKYKDFEPTEEHDYGIDVIDTENNDDIVHQTSL
jgi:hypothetical protein